MRSANETCQKCHWSEKFHGEKLKVFSHYGYDEANSLSETKLLINVGGGSASGGPTGGIHWHMNVSNEITYLATDEKRQNIPWVRMKKSDGTVVEYTAKNSPLSAPQIENAPKRVMDCVDCHNRPAHIFLSPNNAVDQSLGDGKLDISLPFLKSKAVESLSHAYTTTDEAVASIRSDLDGYYRTTYPAIYAEKRQAVDLGDRNTWQCAACHKGDRSFKHPLNLGDISKFQCADCHTGSYEKVKY